MTLAGTPTTIALAGTLLVTTAFAPTSSVQYNSSDANPTSVFQAQGALKGVALPPNWCIKIHIGMIGVANEDSVQDQNVAARTVPEDRTQPAPARAAAR